jgi:hypothetical protein
MGNSIASTAESSSTYHNRLEQLLVPLICFCAIIAIHVRYLRVRL